MKKLLIEEEKRKNSIIQNVTQNPKVLKFCIYGLVIFLIVFTAEIWMVNRLSTYGDKIQNLKEMQSKLELENQILANSIAMESSMVRLEKKASELGFGTISKIEYIKISDKLASAY
jgi:hypothetical protein